MSTISKDNTPCYAVMDEDGTAYALCVIKPEYKEMNAEFLKEHAGATIQTVPVWQARQLMQRYKQKNCGAK